VKPNPTQGDKRVIATHDDGNTLKRLPLPPAKARISDRFPTPPQTNKRKQLPQEVVPDSEEDRTFNKGNESDPDGDDNSDAGHNNHNSQEDNVGNGTSNGSEEENDDEYDFRAETQKDSYVNESEDELASSDHIQNQGFFI
jgi:hypothetical protein